jgi:DNA-directed RNA polymerase
LNLNITWESKITLANTIIEIITNLLIKEIELINWIQKMPRSNSTRMRWDFGEYSDFKPKENYTKVLKREIKLNAGGTTFKTYYNVQTHKANKIAMKNAIFVNIIHSLDALHMQIVITRLTNTQLFTIHDAYLINANYPRDILVMQINYHFKLIHNKHRVFKRIVNRLAQRLGNTLSYDILCIKLNISPPKIDIAMTLVS